MNKEAGKKGYATVSAEEGVDYRTISDTMTAIGWKMNHSSARNHVVRLMRKFVEAYSDAWDVNLTDEQLEEVARSPLFQAGVSEVINDIITRH